jgi:hypothetical protein
MASRRTFKLLCIAGRSMSVYLRGGKMADGDEKDVEKDIEKDIEDEIETDEDEDDSEDEDETD